jgi:ATP-dependent Clp protease adaptor protein ClpS
MLLRFASSGPSAMTTHFDERGPYAVTSFRGVAPLRLAGRDADKEGNGPGGGSKYDTGTVTKTRPKTKRPSLYRVLLLNDDYTPMEFVVLVLQDVFNKSREEAMRIMLHVHNQGVGECGIFPFEVAETKVTRVMDTARKNQHPLQCVMEKE